MSHLPLTSKSHSTAVISASLELRGLINEGKEVVLDGESLSMSAVVAVACHQAPVSISRDPQVHARLKHSVDVLDQKLADGEVIYGVNTGFGGSANTRTENHSTLQQALIQHQESGVLIQSDRQSEQAMAQRPQLSNPYGLKSHSMPSTMVKAAMLVRCNSLLRGHSAVRQTVIEKILILLCNGFIPVIPLRGSISASGDLSPLSYIAGALEGNPDISIRNDYTGDIMPSDRALHLLGLSPEQFGPKEGLGLLNGTAFSCGMASLVLFEANQLVLLSQVLTVMGTEALAGCIGNYHPFVSKVRPHRGQAEAAANIFSFLGDSQLVKAPMDSAENDGLAQDRYALRTSPQWIGPQIENMSLAIQQVHCELNSTTDNPLIDPVNGQVHHGGNFQAAALTSAMEKVMGTMQMLGRMVFSQCTELINPASNNGLPPNLTFDDPSLSFTMKGIDINMAAYMSELSYLNHPVSNHVQSAEMHNQSLNSLALITGRYAAETVEVFSLMSAGYLYALCQALDLRASNIEFARKARGEIDSLTAGLCSSTCSLAEADTRAIQDTMWRQLIGHWNNASSRDVRERSQLAAKSSVGALASLLTMPVTATSSSAVLIAQQEWMDGVSDALETCYITVRAQFQETPTTKNYLCSCSRYMYQFVREELGVPLHCGIVDHPACNTSGHHTDKKKCIGSHISTIYTALREGGFREVLQRSWSLLDHSVDSTMGNHRSGLGSGLDTITRAPSYRRKA